LYCVINKKIIGGKPVLHAGIFLGKIDQACHGVVRKHHELLLYSRLVELVYRMDGR